MFAKTLLIVGDSTGVGVGASKPEDSVGGRLSEYIGATSVENYAVSGAQAKNVSQQIARAQLPRYDVVLVQIGANDLVRFHRVKKVTDELRVQFHKLSALSSVILWTSSGDVGTATIFPFFMRPIYTLATKKYRRAFTELAAEVGVHYVDLFEPRSTDPFAKDPNRYLAPDKFHPSSQGYALWFEKVKRVYDAASKR